MKTMLSHAFIRIAISLRPRERETKHKQNKKHDATIPMNMTTRPRVHEVPQQAQQRELNQADECTDIQRGQDLEPPGQASDLGN